MADYQASTVTGNSWVRSNRVLIENPLGGTPSITFYEEKAVNTGAEVIRTHIGQVVKGLTDQSASFNIVDPVTGVVTGTATHGQVYVLLASLYLDLAMKRDAGQL